MFKYDFLFIEFLKMQMSTFFTELMSYNGMLLHTNIYMTADLPEPVTILDCVNECFNVQSLNCELFVFQNDTCYLGRAGVSNGTSPFSNDSIPIYTKFSKFCNVNNFLFLPVKHRS